MLPELEPLVQDLNRNRLMLAEESDGLSEQEMNVKPGPDQYSGRETLAHLAGAEHGMTRLMQLMAVGQEPRLKAGYNNDYYNARQQEKRARMSVAELRSELEGTRHELLAFMEQLRAEDLPKRGEHPTVGDATVLEVLKTLSSHEWDHLQEFSALARGLRAGRGK